MTIAPLTITLLIVTACGSDGRPEADHSPRPTATTSDQSTVATVGLGVPEALRFRAPLVGGGELDMSTLAGRPVVLWFWAPY